MCILLHKVYSAIHVNGLDCTANVAPRRILFYDRTPQYTAVCKKPLQYQPKQFFLLYNNTSKTVYIILIITLPKYVNLGYSTI